MKTPLVVTFPITLRKPLPPGKESVNQRLPSGPRVMEPGTLCGLGSTYSVIAPLGVIFPIMPTRGLLGVITWFVVVNQRLPSGPVVIDDGAVFGVGIGYSVKTPTVVDRKSTRLNSSHSQISYAVFCLKKK